MRQFVNLYSDIECTHYDRLFYESVTYCVNNIKEVSIVAVGDHILQDESAVSSLKTGKMGGYDNVYNEHLIHGGLLLKHCVSLTGLL